MEKAITALIDLQKKAESQFVGNAMIMYQENSNRLAPENKEQLDFIIDVKLAIAVLQDYCNAKSENND